jgi:hypothetical protein
MPEALIRRLLADVFAVYSDCLAAARVRPRSPETISAYFTAASLWVQLRRSFPALAAEIEG